MSVKIDRKERVETATRKKVRLEQINGKIQIVEEKEDDRVLEVSPSEQRCSLGFCESFC